MLAPGQKRDGFDRLYVPQVSYITGDIDIHDIAIDKQGRIIFVNTLFCCLATVSHTHSFAPVWKPKHFSKLAAEDRCHLNGMAMENGSPKYVTLIGLSMPHSPRVHGGHTWVLNSGYGQLEMVSMESGKRDVVARLPGFTRGLAFWDRFAFVGLSKIREKREFGGLPLEEWLDDKRCGVFAIDVSSGQLVGFMEFTQGCSEIFDVQFLPGFKRPTVLGLSKPTVDGVFIVPPDAMSDAAPELLVQSESDEDDKGDESADV